MRYIPSGAEEFIIRMIIFLHLMEIENIYLKMWIYSRGTTWVLGLHFLESIYDAILFFVLFLVLVFLPKWPLIL